MRDINIGAVSYTHLRAHETVLDLVCRLLLEKKKNITTTTTTTTTTAAQPNNQRTKIHDTTEQLHNMSNITE